MGLVDQLVKPLGMLICLLYRKQYLFPYPLAFKTAILKYYPVPFNFIVSFFYAEKSNQKRLEPSNFQVFFFLTNLSVVSMLPSLLAHLLLLIFKHIITL